MRHGVKSIWGWAIALSFALSACKSGEVSPVRDLAPGSLTRVGTSGSGIGTSPSGINNPEIGLGDFLDWSDPGNLIGYSTSGASFVCNFPNDPLLHELAGRGLMNCQTPSPDILTGDFGGRVLFSGKPLTASDQALLLQRFFGMNPEGLGQFERDLRICPKSLRRDGSEICRTLNQRIDEFKSGLYACSTAENVAAAFRPFVSASPARKFLSSIATGETRSRRVDSQSSLELSRDEVAAIFAFPSSQHGQKEILIQDDSGNRVLVKMSGRPDRESLSNFSLDSDFCHSRGRKTFKERIYGAEDSKINFKLSTKVLLPIPGGVHESSRGMIEAPDLLTDLETLSFESPVDFHESGRMFYATGEKHLDLVRSGPRFPSSTGSSSKFRLARNKINIDLHSATSAEIETEQHVMVPGYAGILQQILPTRWLRVSNRLTYSDGRNGQIRPWAFMKAREQFYTNIPEGSGLITGFDAFEMPLGFYIPQARSQASGGATDIRQPNLVFWNGNFFNSIWQEEALSPAPATDRTRTEYEANLAGLSKFENLSAFSEEDPGSCQVAEPEENSVRSVLSVSEIPDALFVLNPSDYNACTSIDRMKWLIGEYREDFDLRPDIFPPAPEIVEAPVWRD